jgi:hypothetical protein
MSVTAGLRGLITLTDNLTGSTSLTKPVNNSYTGDISVYGQQVIVGTTSYVVALPNNLAEFVYIRNLSATAGTTLTVTWTPNLGTTVNVITLDPGGMIVFSELTTSNGISGLSLVSNQPGTDVEFILAG